MQGMGKRDENGKRDLYKKLQWHRGDSLGFTEILLTHYQGLLRAHGDLVYELRSATID